MSESPRTCRSPKILNLAGFRDANLVKMRQTTWCSLRVSNVWQEPVGPKPFPEAHVIWSSSPTLLWRVHAAGSLKVQPPVHCHTAQTSTSHHRGASNRRGRSQMIMIVA